MEDFIISHHLLLEVNYTCSVIFLSLIKTEIFVKIKLFLTKVEANFQGFPQFGRLREIQMENGKRIHHYDGQCQTTART